MGKFQLSYQLHVSPLSFFFNVIIYYYNVIVFLKNNSVIFKKLE